MTVLNQQRSITIVLLVAVIFIALTSVASAAPDDPFDSVGPSELGIETQRDLSPIFNLAKYLLYALMSFAGLFFVGSMLVSSYKVFFSGGNPEKRIQGVQGWMWSMVALFVALGSWYLAGYVNGFAERLAG